jgi:hypothetical protein
MKSKLKPQDLAAASIAFGIEIETAIPVSSGIEVGPYHRGLPVTTAKAVDGSTLTAPTFEGRPWKAERDGSIRYQSREKACEFVSPILRGPDALQALAEFTRFLDAIGARVNDSCGCHITVSVDSVLMGSDLRVRSTSTIVDARVDFARKLTHIAKWHARAIYGQTGTGRHLNISYSAPLRDDVGTLAKQMLKESDRYRKHEAALQCGRGMLNLRKLVDDGLVEFRAFAGTTNLQKIEHHLATVLGLCRRASQVQCLGAFKKNKLQVARTRTAVDALKFLWDYLGWTGRSRPVALGLFGRLHEDFKDYRNEAMRLCAKFDDRYPEALL